MKKTTHITSESPASTRSIGERLGRAMKAGDVVVLDGELGAGKTTFTQGIGRGLGITEHVTSPTFVVARELPALESHVGLLHVDAYRITSIQEWDDLDLDLASWATVIEWGERVVEVLPQDHLEVHISWDANARLLVATASGARSSELLAAMDMAQ